MDSHVAHPAGLVATLAELMERNCPAVNPPAVDYFLCNVGDLYEPKPNEWLGSPRSTKYFTREQLEKEGVRGLYTKGAQS